jgi:hypothetical protein
VPGIGIDRRSRSVRPVGRGRGSVRTQDRNSGATSSRTRRRRCDRLDAFATRTPIAAPTPNPNTSLFFVTELTEEVSPRPGRDRLSLRAGQSRSDVDWRTLWTRWAVGLHPPHQTEIVGHVSSILEVRRSLLKKRQSSLNVVVRPAKQHLLAILELDSRLHARNFKCSPHRLLCERNA